MSPVFPLGDHRPSLPSTGSLGFLFPKSPRRVLAYLTDPETAIPNVSLYMTHGLASALLVSDLDSAELSSAIEQFQDQLGAFEVWPLENNVVDANAIAIWRGVDDFPTVVPQLPLDDLPGPIGVEVRQFNSNLALLSTAAHEFASELEPLCEWLHQSIADLVSRIREDLVGGEGQDIELAKRLHHDVSILVDVNSCMTMVLSQVADVLPPVLNASFPVGEHSLLGVGSVARSVWQIYQHMSDVFARANHPDRLREGFDSGGFDPGLDPNKFNWSELSTARDRAISRRDQRNNQPGRKHLVYFSSRWGFHETLNAISLSWQTIGSGATREWNLLTLSHEFLHSHFRELVRSNVLEVTSDEDRDKLVEVYNRAWRRTFPSANAKAIEDTDPPATFSQSMQAFLIGQLQAAERADSTVAVVADLSSFIDEYSAPITSADLARLLAAPLLDFVEEVAVHIMDYHYFYNGEEFAYVSSLWHSWSLVPQVHRRLKRYVLRTLLTLASLENSQQPVEAFTSSVVRMRDVLVALKETSGALVAAAIDILDNSDEKKELWLRFERSYRLVVFTRLVLIEDDLYAELNYDSQTVPGPSPRYRVEVGDFPSWNVESPTGFLLDRFIASSDPEAPGVEYESLWQLLILI